MHRGPQGRDDQAPGRYSLRDHLGLARRVSRDAHAAGRLVQRRVVRRGDDRARVRRRVRRPRAVARGAGQDARPGRPSHGRGRARSRLGVDLRPRLLRPNRRAGRPVRGRRAARRDVHQPHPQRGRPALGGGRRADRDRAPGQDPRRDLPHQGGRPRQLGQARRCARADRGSPRLGARGSRPTCTHTRPAPPVSTRRCPPGCRPAASMPGSPGSRTRPPRAGGPRDRPARPRLGEPVQGRRLGRECLARHVQERQAQAAHGQDARRGREALRQDARGNHRRPRHRRRQPGRHDLLRDGRGQPAQGARAAVGEHRLRRGLAMHPRGSSSSRTRIPGLMAPLRGCSGVTSASRRSSRSRKLSGASLRSPPRT